MKSLFVFVPATLLVLFLLNSFVPEKDAANGLVNIVFKSTDGGQTWQDISQGLPENLRENGVRGDSIYANDKGLFLMLGNEVYQSTANSTAPFWKKEFFSNRLNSIAPGKSGMFAFNYWGVHVRNSNGTNVWSPIFEDFHERRMRSAFETASGAIFIGTDRGFFKTTNSGKTWKLVHTGNLVGHLAERDGVLLAISMRKIIRSTDNGETWMVATSEDSVAFDVKPIKAGFVAITSNSEQNSPKTSRLSTSYDGGKTWQPIDAGDKAFSDAILRTWDDRPRVQAFQTSISQVGDNLFCTHPNGIFKSTDKGKTWKLILPSVDDKGFNLFGSGDVIYAIRSKGGC